MTTPARTRCVELPAIGIAPSHVHALNIPPLSSSAARRVAGPITVGLVTGRAFVSNVDQSLRITGTPCAEQATRSTRHFLQH